MALVDSIYLWIALSKNENTEVNVSIIDNEARSRSHCYRGKAMSITYSDWDSLTLGISIQCAILFVVRIYNTFPHYLINGTTFGKKLLNTKCVFWFSPQLLSEIFPILRTERYMATNVYWSSRNVPIIFVRL